MNIQTDVSRLVYKPHDQKSELGRADRADGITTQLVRNALNSAASQMKSVLIRTAFSPVLYEAMDFAVALYDRQVRMLSQAPTLPSFMGTMSFCVEAAVEAVGGEGALNPGDVIFYNLPYGTGSHSPDAAVVIPAFRDGELIGYAASKAHLTDTGAKNPYCSDSIDVFQEGVLFPGVKLYRGGELNKEILNIVLANSRAPTAVKGDIMAEVGCCRAGIDELLRIVDRFGPQVFMDCVERMYEHGEAVVRDYISRIPSGRYKGEGHLDNDGLDDEPIHFEVELIINEDEVIFDLHNVPDALAGPLNCPFPSTVAACRTFMAMLAGNEAPNEGHFRPLQLITREGSMYHPLHPQPSFMYGWPIMQLTEAMLQAMAKALPNEVPSGSAGDLCGVMFWAFDKERRETQVVANPLPVGLGAFPDGDGNTMFIHGIAQSRMPSAELWETKCHFVQFDRWELAANSGGAGKYRGGLGWNIEYRMLRDVQCMTTIERTKVPSWGQAGGESGRPNAVIINYPDGRSQPTTKVTGVSLPKGTMVEVQIGGGGGFGKPSERAPEDVMLDVRHGKMTESQARKHYPHAFPNN